MGAISERRDMHRRYFKRERKARNGGKDMCTCGSLDCDPFTENPKLVERNRLGLCIGCGKIPADCHCRSRR